MLTPGRTRLLLLQAGECEANLIDRGNRHWRNGGGLSHADFCLSAAGGHGVLRHGKMDWQHSLPATKNSVRSPRGSGGELRVIRGRTMTASRYSATCIILVICKACVSLVATRGPQAANSFQLFRRIDSIALADAESFSMRCHFAS